MSRDRANVAFVGVQRPRASSAPSHGTDHYSHTTPTGKWQRRLSRSASFLDTSNDPTLTAEPALYICSGSPVQHFGDQNDNEEANIPYIDDITHLLADSPEVGLDSIDTLSHEKSIRKGSTTSSTGGSDTNVKTLPQIGRDISRWSLRPRKRYKQDGELNDRASRAPDGRDANVQGQVEVKLKHKRNSTSTGMAVTLYTIRNGGGKNYTVRRVRQSLPKWEDLQSLASLSYTEQIYSIHDAVYILIEDGRDEMAQIRQIRDLGNGRKVILVLWYYSREETRTLKGINMSAWPGESLYMVSTRMQVLAWDTLNGKVGQAKVSLLADKKIVDVCSKSCRIYDHDDGSMEWLP